MFSSWLKSTLDAMLILFSLLILVNIIAFLVENIKSIFIVILIIIIIIIAIIIMLCVLGKRLEKKEEKKRNLDIINTNEKKPRLVEIPKSETFEYAKEAEINRQFIEFLKQNNKIIEASAHIEYLNKKATAFKALKQQKKANLVEQESKKTRNKVAETISKRITYDSNNDSLIYQNEELMNAYSSFAKTLGNSRVKLLKDFFQDPMVKAISVKKSNVLLFTPAYILNYSIDSKVFHIITYKEISISTHITSEKLSGKQKSTDEIEHVGYLYETKDGNRDMRYNNENNPKYTFVYRGIATICCDGISFEKKFSNKSLTESFEKSFKAYLSLINGKYSAVVNQVLNNNIELLQSEKKEDFVSEKSTD